MAGMKFKLDGETYDVDMNKVTLGEGRFLKAEFGMTSYEELSLLDPDPDLLVGILAVAIKRKHPELDDDEIISKVEQIPQADYFGPMLKQLQAAIEKAQAAEKDPTAAGTSAVSANGSSGTTPKKRGRARSANAA